MRPEGLEAALRGRVLVAQTAWLGDVALCTALLRGLRLGLKPRRLDLLVGRPVQQLLAGSPSVDEVLCLEKRSADGGLGGICRAGRRLRGRYDAAIVPVRSWRTALVLAVAGIPWRIGFQGHGARWLLHRTVPYPAGMTQVERLAALAPEVDWLRVGLQTELRVTPAEQRSAEELLREVGLDPARPGIAVHPGSAWATKRWPAERFGEVAGHLCGSGSVQGIVLGTAEDRALGDRVIQSSGGSVGLVNLCGRTDLGVLKALLRWAKILLTNDSGPLHVAEALGTPVVAVFGSTRPQQGFGPRLAGSRVAEVELMCRPCGPHGRLACPLGHFRCMLDLPAAAVHLAALETLGGGTSA